MRVLMADSQPSLVNLLRRLLRSEIDPATIDRVERLDDLSDGADLYIIVLNNLFGGWQTNEDRWSSILRRAVELQAQAGVIVMAGAPEDAEARALAAGVKHFFPLPFDVAQFLDLVRQQLRDRQPSRPLAAV